MGSCAAPTARQPCSQVVGSEVIRPQRRPRRPTDVPNVYRRVGAFWLSTGTEPRLIGRPGPRPRRPRRPTMRGQTIIRIQRARIARSAVAVVALVVALGGLSASA